MRFRKASESAYVEPRRVVAVAKHRKAAWAPSGPSPVSMRWSEACASPSELMRSITSGEAALTLSSSSQ